MSKTMVSILVTLSLVLVAGMGNAQQSSNSVSAPVLTFVLDNEWALRPLNGVAGSASVGARLDLGFAVVEAAIPPDHDYILTTTSESNWPTLVKVRGDTVTIQSLDAFFNQRNTAQAQCYAADSDSTWGEKCPEEPGPIDEFSKIDRIALSPGGSAAAFLSQSKGRIYSIANLSQSPILLGTFEISGTGWPSAFAISDDGRTLALGISDGVTGSLFLVNLNQAPRLIAAMRHPSAISFLRNSNTAIIADDVDNTIYNLSSGYLFTVATSADGISGPVGLAVSNDNQQIFVGNSAPGSVTTIGPYGNVAAPLHCNCTLTGLHPTNTDSVFRLTDFSGAPVLLFDGGSQVPRIIFVPVGAQ